ncbi:MAG TPA: ABC transporter substrate-binding protein [Acidimicrobiales bacterium]|nr:ABC transporter substrate-binding protein [Acidimicrobiales bacterium]
MTRIVRKKWRASMAAAGALTLLLTGCGARLTAAQEAALNGAAGSAGGGGASGGQLQAAGSGGSTQAASSNTVPGLAAASGGAESGQASTSAKTGTAASSSGGGGSSGASTVAPADDPLAGPNGKLCPAGAPSSDPGVTAKTITVGNIATINGPVPGLFAGARYGAEAVAAYINSMGGLCGRQLVVDSADDQFDQATDQNEASSMASQVLAFMGSFSLQDAGIPAGAPNVPDIGEALSSQRFDSPMNFSPSPEAPGYQTSAYQWFIQSPVYHEATQHMALLVENTPQTAQTGTWEESALQSVGFKFIFVDKTLQPTDPTFNGDVQKMKAAGVQGVIFQATGQITGQLANAMYQAGMKIVLGNYSPAAYDPAYLQNAGPGAAGTILSQSMALYDGQDANQVPMVATLDQWYARVDPGQVPDVYAVYSWLAGLLLAQAINTTGAPTRANIVAGIKQIGQFNGDGLVAPGDPATKTPPTCFVLIDVKNGQFVRDPATPTGFKCSPAGYYHA